MRIPTPLIALFGAMLAQTAQVGAAQTTAPQTAPLTSSVAAVSAEADPNLPGARLLRFSSTVRGDLTGVAGAPVTMRFALYADQEGGEPVWSEVQRVEVARDGSYTVLLGAGTAGGLPVSAFAGGNARWLSVELGESEGSEQPRLMLVGVPYAMESADAQTLGGYPASAFVLAAQLKAGAAAAVAQAIAGAHPLATGITGSGTKDHLAKFTSASTIGDSQIFDNGTAVGIGTKSPAALLDVAGAATFQGVLSLPALATATTTAGASSWPLNLTGSIYVPPGNPSSSGAPVSETFQWQVEPFLNDTSVAQNYLSLNYIQGTNKPVPILLINNVGRMSFPYNGGYSFIPGLSVPNIFTGTQTFDNTGAAIDAKSTGSGSSAINATDTGNGGTAITANGAGYGIFANGTGSGGVGVFGSGYWAVQAVGKVYGVYATANQPDSAAVFAQTTGSGLSIGVDGQGGAFGVVGEGTVNGVYGHSTTAGATGVQGYAPAYGVYGTGTASGSTGVYGTAPQYGVYGTSAQFGVYGNATGSSDAAGVYGNAGTGTGVQGKGVIGVNGSGSLYGLFGQANSTGVYGDAVTYGVYGIATGTSGNPAGVYGTGTYGVQGVGNSYGVYSSTASGKAGAYGVYGARSSTGNDSGYTVCIADCGESFSVGGNIPAKAGLWADTNYDGDTSTDNGNKVGTFVPALLVTADATAGAVMLNVSKYAPTLVLANNAAGGIGPNVLRAEGRDGVCTLSGAGDVSCTGSLKTLAKARTAAGERQVETYALQSAESWLEDAGTAQLVNGVARVNLEPVFGQTVNTGIEYHVFLTPDGDCKGLYVSKKDANGFEVRELGGGTASIAFEYRIMAKRAGHESERLVDVAERDAIARKAQADPAAKPAE